MTGSESKTIEKPQVLYVNTPISVEFHNEGTEVVAIPILTRQFTDFIEFQGYRVSINNFNLKNPIQGSWSKLRFKLEFTPINPESVHSIKYPENIPFIRFVFTTKRYWEFIRDNNKDGLLSADINIEFYVNGNFKPWCREQMYANGVEILKDEMAANPQGHKFYELTSVDSASNYLTEDGTNFKPENQVIPCYTEYSKFYL